MLKKSQSNFRNQLRKMAQIQMKIQRKNQARSSTTLTWKVTSKNNWRKSKKQKIKTGQEKKKLEET